MQAKFIAGRLCLDFVNTVGGRAGGTVIRDKISTYQDWLDWSVIAGILDTRAARVLAGMAQSNPRMAGGVGRRSLRLREALYRILLSAREGRQPSAADAGVLRAELGIARANQRLAIEQGRFVWTFSPAEALDRFLWPVVLSAADLLTSGEVSKLGQCAGADCGWLFLDSRGGHRRRWCDMRDCGNRAKVRRFRARNAG